jgi:hypothetical protein
MSARTRKTTAILSAAAAAAAVTLTAVPANAATTAKTASPAVEVCGQGASVTHPTSMVLTCADDGEVAKNLTWTNWSATSATATGQVSWRGGGGHDTTWQSTGAQLTLTDPVSEPGQGRVFTRLVLHVTGSTPRGFMRDVTFDETPVPAVAPPTAKLESQVLAPSGHEFGGSGGGQRHARLRPDRGPLDQRRR